MKNKEYTALVNKYALLLFVGFALNEGLKLVLGHLNPEAFSDPLQGKFPDYVPMLILLAMNIVATVWVYRDLKKFNLRSTVIWVMTFFFSLIGITMFFIFINRAANEQARQEPAHETE